MCSNNLKSMQVFHCIIKFSFQGMQKIEKILKNFGVRLIYITSRNAPVLGRRSNLCELIFYDIALRVDTAVICLIPKFGPPFWIEVLFSVDMTKYALISF
jgi:hypothetical protein